MSGLRLISFKLCPFVQRSVILLLEKRVPYDITYIDLANKPDWFLAISPRGKVPVLEVDGAVLFESAAINEFLDETNPPAMHPVDPVRRAHNRAWVEVANDLTGSQFMYATKTDAAEFQPFYDTFAEQLRRLEAELGDGPFFNGENFCLIDAAFAPVFTRLAILERDYGIAATDGLPKVAAYSEALLARPSVRGGVPDDFEVLYHARMEKQGTYLWQRSQAA